MPRDDLLSESSGLGRRQFLAAALALGATAALGGATVPAYAGDFGAACRTNWARGPAWRQLKRRLGPRLIRPTSPIAVCLTNPSGSACTSAITNLQNPWLAMNDPGAVLYSGRYKGWEPKLSPYAVAAESTADVAAAVNFARECGVKLVIKSTGHDYLGRSNSANSLLIWLHRMRRVKVVNNFVPKNAPSGHKGVHAISFGPGTRWLTTYQAATAAKRLVSGGVVTNVGVSGFIQGGGYGVFSKRIGAAAASVLEFEVVTADGQIRIANAFTNPDLFWALRGGGAGTYGVVTRMTEMTYPMPKTAGTYHRSVIAQTDDQYVALLAHYLDYFMRRLNIPNLGVTNILDPTRLLDIQIFTSDLSQQELNALLDPFYNWVAAQPGLTMTAPTSYVFPFKRFWDGQWLVNNVPGLVQLDPRDPNLWDYTGVQGAVNGYIDAQVSRWLPKRLFKPANTQSTAQLLALAASYTSFMLVSYKGLYGCPRRIDQLNRMTAINPAAFDSPMLYLSGNQQGEVYPGIPGHEPNYALSASHLSAQETGIGIIRKATPTSGTFGNESDYNEPNWRRSTYGTNYRRLQRIKKKYDRKNLFSVHHGVAPRGR